MPKRQQQIRITREFDLPLKILFKAYIELEIVKQWMSTKVLKLENKNHVRYRFETTNPQGNKHRFNGTIHEFILNQTITRTFEMENTPFPVQLEFLEFESLSDSTSKFNMYIVYRSIANRDKMLPLPFAHGLNMAHNHLEEVLSNLN